MDINKANIYTELMKWALEERGLSHCAGQLKLIAGVIDMLFRKPCRFYGQKLDSKLYCKLLDKIEKGKE